MVELAVYAGDSCVDPARLSSVALEVCVPASGVKCSMQSFRASAGFLQRGMTFIEMVMVMALLAVLTTVAVANYSSFIADGRRADAVAVMEEVRRSMERHYARTFSYADAQAGTTYPDKSPVDGSDTFYSITVSVSGASDYEVTATPAPLQVDECGTLTITRAGVRSNSGGLANEECFE